jgi:sugar/nucleoside kinase (ribokinase family)
VTVRLISVGNVVVDVVVEVEALPPPGGDVLAAGGGLWVGGTFNVLVAARRHDMAAVYGGALGDGPLGRLATDALAGEGVAVAGAPVAGVDTGFSVAAVDGAGERTFLSVVGAEATLTADRLAALRPGAGDWVLVSGYGLAHAANRATLVAWAPALDPGVTVVFDPGPLAYDLPPDAVDTVLARADWCVTNAREGAELAGAVAPQWAANALAGRVRAGSVVRDGPRGCWLATGGVAPVRVPGFLVEAVDTNGAGDAHTGAFIARMAGGATAEDAARLANAAAAIAVTRRGPATCPTAAEVDAWIAGRG